MAETHPLPTCVSVDDLPPIPRARPNFFGPRTQIALGSCACAAASLFVYAVDPSKNAVYPECLLYNATGLYCAGCGATRALYALLHGRVLLALHDNVLFAAGLPVLLYFMASIALPALRTNTWPRIDVQPRRVLWSAAGIFALLIIFSILRNLPGPAFDWLKPLP